MPSVKEFLSAILGPPPTEELYAELKPIPVGGGKVEPVFFRYPAELDALCTQVATLSGKQNVYFGTSLFRARRGTNENVASCRALFVDIDYQKTPYPKAVELLKTFPLKASIVVSSGGGVHVYFLLKEPVTDRELLKKDGLIQRINTAIANAVGGDKCSNVAWVLRVPGTLNLKYRPAPTVTILAWRPELQYNLSDFDFLVLEAPPTSSAPALEVVVPSQTATVDLDKFTASELVKQVIREGLPAFVAHHKRTDTPEQFAARKLSRSEADYYVITQLVYCDATDAEIFAVFRNPEYKIGEKYRERGTGGDSYLAHSIQRARAVKKNYPRVSVDTAIDRVASHMRKEEGDDRFRLLKIIKTTFDPPLYEISCILPDGKEYTVKNVAAEMVTSYSKFRDYFFTCCDLFPPEIGPKAWRNMLASVPVLEKKVIPPAVASIRGEIKAAFEDFLSKAEPFKDTGQLEYFAVHEDDGVVSFKLRAFVGFLRDQGVEIQQQRPTIKDVIQNHNFEYGPHRVGKGVHRVWYSRNGNTPDEPERTTPQEDIGFVTKTPI
jgi:hypothetical protein